MAGLPAADLLDAQRRAELGKIPLFYGDNNDVFTAEQWMERINYARNALDPAWNGATTVAAVYGSLRGKALQWFEALRDELDFTDFNILSTNFINAFSKTRTTRTVVSKIESLQQKPDEEVVNFFSRVAKANRDCNALNPVVLANVPLPDPWFEAVFTNVPEFAALGANAREGQARRLVAFGMNARPDYFARMVFIAGLKDKIREQVLMNPRPGGLRAAYEQALDIEKAIELPKASVKAIKVHKDDSHQDVDAIKSKRRGNPTKKTHKKNVTCYHCQKKGHFAKECFSKARGEPPVAKRGSKVSTVNTRDVYDDENYLEKENRQEVSTINNLNF